MSDIGDEIDKINEESRELVNSEWFKKIERAQQNRIRMATHLVRGKIERDADGNWTLRLKMNEAALADYRPPNSSEEPITVLLDGYEPLPGTSAFFEQRPLVADDRSWRMVFEMTLKAYQESDSDE